MGEIAIHDVSSDELKLHPKFPSLVIARNGCIFSTKTGKSRRLWKTRHGYLQLAVARTSYLAHRLVADVWVENPLAKPFVNHKNGVKDDNRAENLEWCTQIENVRHARDVLGVKFSLPGYDHPTAKITKKEARIIIRLFSIGLSLQKNSGNNGSFSSNGCKAPKCK